MELSRVLSPPTPSAAGMVANTASPQYRTAPAGGIAQKWKEGTLTLAYLPTSQMELRGEVRYDKSDKSVFGMVSGAPKDSQSSVGVEALYKF